MHMYTVTYIIVSVFCRNLIVNGEANFVMSSTRLTVGGFTQPGVARSLIEMPANAEKGLSQRFMWMFPNPLFSKFSNLRELDPVFLDKISKSDNADTNFAAIYMQYLLYILLEQR